MFPSVRNPIVRLCSAVLLVLWPATAMAQDYDGGALDMTGMSAYAMTPSMMQAAGQRMHSAGPSLRRQFTSAPARGARAIDSLPYRSVPAVRKKVVRLFVDNGPRDPRYQADIRNFIGSGRVFQAYASEAPSYGLRLNDAVDAYTIYLMGQWKLANNYQPEFARAQIAGIRGQASRALVTVAPSLQSAAARQEFAETLIAQAAMILGAHDDASKSRDTARLREMAAAARRGGSKVFDMDPTRLTLTNAGFRPR